MLETIYEQEKSLIEELDLDEDIQSIQDISMDELIELDYGWQIMRTYEYLYEKKSLLEELKKQAVILKKTMILKQCIEHIGH